RVWDDGRKEKARGATKRRGNGAGYKLLDDALTLWRWLGTSADPGCINEPEQRASLYNPSRVRSNLDGTVVYQTRQVIRLWHLLFRFTGKPTPVRIRLHSRPIPRAVCIAPAAQSATGIVPAATATAASPQSPS